MIFQLEDQSTSTELGRYCGADLPAPQFTSSNRLRIVFHTDGSHGGQGFLLRWQAVSGTTAGVGVTPPTAANATNPPGTVRYDTIREQATVTRALRSSHNLCPPVLLRLRPTRPNGLRRL